MAFLESLGRSNALSSVNNLMGKAIELRQGEDRSAERAYTMGLQTEELGIHKAAADREATKFGWQAEEQAKKQKFLKSVVPVDTLLQSARPGSREALLKLGKDNGWIQDVGGNLIISNENLANAKQYLNTNLEFTSLLALTDVADINKEMVPLKQQLAELASTKPDDKNIPILQKRIADLDKQKTEHLNSAVELDKQFQEKKALADAAAASKNKLIRTKAGVVLQANDQGGYDEIYTPPEKVVEPKTDQDRFVEDRVAGYKAKTGKDATPDQRSAWRMEYHRSPGDSSKAESTEDKRKVKALTETRKEVERAYGFSQFLPTAQDPLLLQKVEKGKAIAEDIIDNYRDHGLSKEPTPGKAAQMAKIKVDAQYNKKPSAPSGEDKKTKSIRELLFGPENK